MVKSLDVAKLSFWSICRLVRSQIVSWRQGGDEGALFDRRKTTLMFSPAGLRQGCFCILRFTDWRKEDRG